MISRVIWLFMSILFGIITVLFARQVWYAHVSKNWPITQGVVVAFYGEPEYKYSVDGHTYSSSHTSCNELFGGVSLIQNSSKYAMEYPLEAKVTVHYCPQKPELAVLETRFDPKGLLFVAVFVLMTFLCFAGYVFGWKFRLSWRRFPQITLMLHAICTSSLSP